MNRSPSVNLKPALGLASKGRHKSYHTLSDCFVLGTAKCFNCMI